MLSGSVLLQSEHLGEHTLSRRVWVNHIPLNTHSDTHTPSKTEPRVWLRLGKIPASEKDGGQKDWGGEAISPSVLVRFLKDILDEQIRFHPPNLSQKHRSSVRSALAHILSAQTSSGRCACQRARENSKAKSEQPGACRLWMIVHDTYQHPILHHTDTPILKRCEKRYQESTLAGEKHLL